MSISRRSVLRICSSIVCRAGGCKPDGRTGRPQGRRESRVGSLHQHLDPFQGPVHQCPGCNAGDGFKGVRLTGFPRSSTIMA